MTAWHVHDSESMEERAARRALESAAADAVDEFNERRYGVTHGMPDFRLADEWGDLLNGDDARDRGKPARPLVKGAIAR